MNHKFILIASVLIFVFNSGFAQSQKEIFTEDYITSTVGKACDWQLNNLFSKALLATGRIRDIPETGWIRGVFYTGVMAAYRVTEQENLYSKEDSLFFRDAHHIIQPDGSHRKTESGKKVFWSRGNGWVLAGLAKVLTWLPEDYTTRPAFEEVFLEMASKIASLQQDDGFWRSSLYDPDQFKTPETSGSGFFCFALAWGINEGLLDKEHYLPVVKKAWQGLNEAIDESGKLGYVQQVGSSPNSVSKDDAMEYGTAAYILAAEQVLKLVRTNSIN